jgi:altronate hydrolase
MTQKTLKVHPLDNVLVALQDLALGEKVFDGDKNLAIVLNPVKAKHKIALEDFETGDQVHMYGVLVGKTTQKVQKGEQLTTFNLKHASQDFNLGKRKTNWDKPDVSKFVTRTFKGFKRANGEVGTGNYWLVVPLVFCENRNLEVMKEALVSQLGFGSTSPFQDFTQSLIASFKNNGSIEKVTFQNTVQKASEKLFKNIDGIKFLTHSMGCGGTRQDAQALCGLLAGYITHPNVCGATVFSLGCQNAQFEILEEEIQKRGGMANRPLYFLEQQKIGTEETMVSEAIKKTFEGLIEANKCERENAPISKLVIGLECGGSDGFSGISANPAVGYASDLLVACGGSVILSEFPELCGVEQELSDRCVDEKDAERFIDLMRTYNTRAKAAGSGFDMNPSPGNIKDGLITDAIKSAGAAKKGGTSPITGVYDYPEKVNKKGLALLCTPGNDVESTTAEVASGANIVLFTTGLGTPTGNPIAPVIKIATNTILAEKMNDIIDIDTGTIINGQETIAEAGERILDFVIRAASGEQEVFSITNGQDDFIPWKRGVSL